MEHKKLPHDHGNGRGRALLFAELAQTQRINDAAELFRQLSDPTRVKIFRILMHGEECVINLSALLGMTSPAVFHHLRPMKESGMIESRREGKEVYYRLTNREENHLLEKMLNALDLIERGADACRHSSSREEIEKVHRYLLEHLNERITIEQLSRQFLMNATTLKQAFKEAYGTSVAAHMHAHRMKSAAQALRHSDQSIAAIAQGVGFGSQSRFTAAFKKYFSCTPTEYRKKHTSD